MFKHGTRVQEDTPHRPQVPLRRYGMCNVFCVDTVSPAGKQTLSPSTGKPHKKALSRTALLLSAVAFILCIMMFHGRLVNQLYCRKDMVGFVRE